MIDGTEAYPFKAALRTQGDAVQLGILANLITFEKGGKVRISRF